jgi:hypothetical protein
MRVDVHDQTGVAPTHPPVALTAPGNALSLSTLQTGVEAWAAPGSQTNASTAIGTRRRIPLSIATAAQEFASVPP